MSIKKGSDTIAGFPIVDNIPTSGSTHVVSSGGVYSALADKANTGHEVIEFQAPTAGNNYTWYRKYADGWVEQGGQSAANTTATLPIEMANSSYEVTACALGTTVVSVGINRINTTSMYINTNAQVATWRVSGMAA